MFIRVALFILCSSTASAASNWMVFVSALEIKESHGNYQCIDGDDGRAIGGLQIHLGVVMRVNTIYDTEYTHEDCRDKAKARHICILYLRYQAKRYHGNTGNVPTWEVLARIWNKGYNGRTKDSATRYWNHVKQLIEGIENAEFRRESNQKPS